MLYIPSKHTKLFLEAVMLYIPSKHTKLFLEAVVFLLTRNCHSVSFKLGSAIH